MTTAQSPRRPVTTSPLTRVAAAGVLALFAPLLAGCGSEEPLTSNQAGRTVLVEASGQDCQLSKRGAPVGEITFTVRNSGDSRVDFSVLTADQAELGTTTVPGGKLRDLVVDLPAGDLVTSCSLTGRSAAVTTDFAVSEGDPGGGY